jgi:RNA polymerase sigma factor (sigma-70 family)
MLRRKKVRQKYKKSFPENSEMTETVNYGSDLDAKYLQQKLRAAITRLPEYLREVVVLRDLAELPYERVSRILGIKAGTARVYRSKAIALLASWLNKEESRG